MIKLFVVVSILSLFSCRTAGGEEDLDIAKICRQPKVGEAISLPIKRQQLVFNESNGRFFYLPLALKGRSKIRITIWKGSDNSGDKGMTWQVVDSTFGETYGTGSAKKDKKQVWKVTGIRTNVPILILEDKDTRFSGKYPGNSFEISVGFAD